MPDKDENKKENTGIVMVSSNVEGADIYVDGIFVGNTPANLKLESGIHIIEVKWGMKILTIQGLGSWRSYTGLPRYFSFTGGLIPLWCILP